VELRIVEGRRFVNTKNRAFALAPAATMAGLISNRLTNLHSTTELRRVTFPTAMNMCSILGVILWRLGLGTAPVFVPLPMMVFLESATFNSLKRAFQINKLKHSKLFKTVVSLNWY